MFLLFAKVREESGGGGRLFKRGACLTLWPSKWVLIWGGGGCAFYDVGAYLPSF